MVFNIDLGKLPDYKYLSIILTILALTMPGFGYLWTTKRDMILGLDTSKVILLAVLYSLPIFLIWILNWRLSRNLESAEKGTKSLENYNEFQVLEIISFESLVSFFIIASLLYLPTIIYLPYLSKILEILSEILWRNPLFIYGFIFIMSCRPFIKNSYWLLRGYLTMLEIIIIKYYNWCIPRLKKLKQRIYLLFSK